ncbi:Rhodanese-like domain-containing protein [Lipomyces doorenjongii]|uniref:Rhodanese-like domain-containing protein n=1 Tax=Lipomyces doorenjongii TaxID=383834 RepID=UPI0034CEAD93
MRPPSRVSISSILTPAAFKSLLVSSKTPIIPLDATWYLPNVGRNGKEEFLLERIPGARFFDIDEVKDASSQYPHMLPSTEVFNKAMSDLGITREDTLVVYDKQGNFSAPRLLWTLKIFQHPSIFILDNYPLYKQEGYEIETKRLATVEEAIPTQSTYESPGAIDDRVVTYSDLRQVIIEPLFRKKFNIIDARPYSRWTGDAPEPRPGLPSGHLPDSISIPFNEVLEEGTKEFKNSSKLQELFLAKGVDPDKPIIAMCGTGVTACVLETALGKSGLLREDKPVMVYDGSWTEWAQRSDDKFIIKGKQ